MSDSKSLKILRAVHQKVIFPPHYYLKNKIEDVMGTEFKYKDDKGHWHVVLDLFDDHAFVRMFFFLKKIYVFTYI